MWLRAAWRLFLSSVTVAVVGGTGYAVLLGCASDPAPAATGENKSAEESAEVGLAYGGGYGKAVFVVYPGVNVGPNQECFVDVPTADGPRKIECNSQYVVVCDRDIPNDRPFCTLVSEIGSDRESAYPKQKRQ